MLKRTLSVGLAATALMALFVTSAPAAYAQEGGGMPSRSILGDRRPVGSGGTPPVPVVEAPPVAPPTAPPPAAPPAVTPPPVATGGGGTIVAAPITPAPRRTTLPASGSPVLPLEWALVVGGSALLFGLRLRRA